MVEQDVRIVFAQSDAALNHSPLSPAPRAVLEEIVTALEY